VSDMDNAGTNKTAIESLRTVEFRLGLRGYDVDEVDDYLEKVAVEADALQEQLRQMTDRLRQAAERIAQLESNKPAAAPEPAVQAAPTPNPVTEAAETAALSDTLAMAQRFVEQTKRESEAEAAKTIATAREEARKLQAEAEDRYKADLSRLEGLKTKLTSDVESMARQLESERTRLRSSLSEMIQWIEDNVQPGAAIMALRQGGPEPEAIASADSSGPSQPGLASSGSSSLA
jgi:cell division initiation protein